MWSSAYLCLESYLPTSERCWQREFVKMRVWNLQSLLVYPIILWESSLLRVEWISGWRSHLKSRIQDCVWNLKFTTCNGSSRTCKYKCVLRKKSRIEFSWIKGRRRRSWICRNVSIPCDLAIILDHDKMEITQVDWERVMVHWELTRHPKNLESFKQ